MELKLTTLGKTGLCFFGKMSAANAHEIKNALAIINENAGLLEDLVAMAEQGVPLDHQRLKRLAAKVKQQVMRADEIAKSTNRFAHSVDNMNGPANLGQSLALVTTMAMRFATQRHITLEIVPSVSAITLSVQPFVLHHLLWLCLEHAMEATDAEETIKIRMDKIDGGTSIRFGPLSHLESSAVKSMVESEETDALLSLLEGKIEADLQARDLVLTLIK